MLRVTWEANRQTRINQVTNLVDQICDEYPIRININKITDEMRTINLGWILAIIRKGFNCFGDINFFDPALCAMAETMINAIHTRLEDTGELAKLGIPRCEDEPDFLFQRYKKKFNYRLPPNIAISLLTEGATFNRCLTTNSNEKIKQIANNQIHLINKTAINFAVTNTKNTTNHIDKSNTNLYQLETNMTNNDAYQKNSDLATSLANNDDLLENNVKQNDQEKNIKKKIDKIIIGILNKQLIDVIRDVNPNYTGNIHNKTSAPLKLIIKVIAIMIKLDTPKNEIVWPSIHDFIDKHIYNDQELKTSTGLDEINEEEIIVRGITVIKKHCQNNISNYKKKVFAISR